MRFNEQSSERANALASVVLPTPGTSSINTCPLHKMALSISSMAVSLPITTLPMLRVSACATRCVACMCFLLLPLVFTGARPDIAYAGRAASAANAPR